MVLLPFVFSFPYHINFCIHVNSSIGLKVNLQVISVWLYHSANKTRQRHCRRYRLVFGTSSKRHHALGALSFSRRKNRQFLRQPQFTDLQVFRLRCKRRRGKVCAGVRIAYVYGSFGKTCQTRQYKNAGNVYSTSGQGLCRT